MVLFFKRHKTFHIYLVYKIESTWYHQHLSFLEQMTIESSSPQLQALRITLSDACCYNIVALF